MIYTASVPGKRLKAKPGIAPCTLPNVVSRDMPDVVQGVPGILLVAFGVTTRYGKPALAAFTQKVQAIFPRHTVRWAFTARHKVKRPTLKGEPGMEVADALSLFRQEKVSRIAVQPLHLIPGREHTALCRRIETWQQQNQSTCATICVGEPLLPDEKAMRAVLTAMHALSPCQSALDEVRVWVGHGSKNPDRTDYTRLAELAAQHNPPIFVGCLSNTPGIEDIRKQLTSAGKSKVCLMPFFALSGYHAAKDVAGGNEGSWKSRFSRTGITCRTELRGLVEYEAFADMWIDRLRVALKRLEDTPPRC